MRLTCPNCGAQYEVPSEVIPPEGRDVQCSACGDTWFQAHRDRMVQDDPAMDDPADTAPEPDPGSEPVDPVPEAGPVDAAEPPPATAPRPRGLDPEIAGILKEEARREAELRARDTGGGLESQPELGLDDMQDEATRRAQEARDRMARLRGADDVAPPQADARPDPEAEPTAGSRRDLLPDIDEINSTLRNSGSKTNGRTDIGPASEAGPRRKSGFARGFTVAMILGLVLFLLYGNAAKLAESVPQAEPALSAYVGTVDKGRIWLDGLLGDMVPR